MFYQLSNGKVVEISVEQYFDMSDEDIEYLIAFNYGNDFENPWTGSILVKQSKEIEDTPEIMPEIPDIPDEQKIQDLDVDFETET